MEVYCTRFGCPRPRNHFTDLDNSATLRTVQQKFCTACGMPLLLQGRYIPQKLLGKGGFGAAFLARDRYTPAMRQCVVKQFQPSGDLSPNQLQVAQTLFQREAEVLEQLGSNHPQIPDLLAFFELEVPSLVPGKTDRFFYLVQEFIDGRDLEQLRKREGVQEFLNQPGIAGIALMDGRSRPYFFGVDQTLNFQQKEALAQGIQQVVQTTPPGFEYFEFQFSGHRVYIYKFDHGMILLVLATGEFMLMPYAPLIHQLQAELKHDPTNAIATFRLLAGNLSLSNQNYWQPTRFISCSNAALILKDS